MAERSETSFPTIPGYRIESILGRGSMATVYRARQLAMDRPVALKVLREEVAENAKLLKRLMREARLAARFTHPHIVRALDAGVHEGSCYFVMDLVEGKSLRDLVERDGPFSEERTVELAVEIAEALSELHRAHVVHRDVKPANIIVDREHKALLADLGLAKIEFDSSMTSQHRTVGTPAFMAPEQAKDPERVDSRADLFSFGATLFYMMTGRSPFEAANVSAVITKVLYEETPPLSSEVLEVSAEFEQIVGRLLEKDPSRRYATPSALLRDLRALLRGAALPLGSAASRRAFSRRSIGAAAAAAVLIATTSAILLSRRGDTAPPETAPQRSAQSSEVDLAATRIDEVQLEADLLRVVGGIEGALRTRMAAGDVVTARLLIDTDWRERFEREMGGPLAELPRIAQLRWENARLGFERIIDTENAARREAAITDLRAAYDLKAAQLERSEVFLDRDEIIAALLALEADGLVVQGLDQATFKLVRTQTAEKLLSEWRRDFDHGLELARSELAASRHDESLAILDQLELRLPQKLGGSAIDAMAALRTQIEGSRDEGERRVANALALVDVLPPLGSPELRSRQFEHLRERLAPVIEKIDESAAGAEVIRLRAVVRVLDEASAWPARLVSELRADRLRSTTELFDLDGVAHSVSALREIGDEILVLRGAGEVAVELPLARVAVTTLETLVGGKDLHLREQVAAFLDYCDGNLLDAELRLGRLAVDDPFRVFLNERMKSAWVGIANVKSAQDREAFRLWSETLAAFRAGQFEDAASKAAPLRDDAELKNSDWYRGKRADIRRVLDEVDLRLAVMGRLGPHSKRLELVRLEPPTVRGAWTFDSEEELSDFKLDSAFSWREGELARVTAEPDGQVAPDKIAAIRLDLDADPEAGPVDLEFELRTSANVEESPRVLVISLLGHHVGVLSRLRQTLPFRHLELHGAERLVHDFLVFGRIATWSGDLAGYRQAFSVAVRGKRLLLDPGQRYRFELRLDPKDKTLSLRVDGEDVFTRKLESMAGGAKGIEIRAPMPFALEGLRVSAVLALD